MPTGRISIAITDGGVWAAHLENTRHGWEILRTTHRVANTPIAMPRPEEMPALADVILAAVSELQGTQRFVRLVIPATWTMIHAVELPNLASRGKASEFELEAFLPIPIEEVTTVFVDAGGVEPSGLRRRIGIAVETRPLRELLSELASAGLRVDTVVPTFPSFENVGDAAFLGRIWCDLRTAVLTLSTPDGDLASFEAFALGSEPCGTLALHIQGLQGATASPGIQWFVTGRTELVADIAHGTDLKITLHSSWPADAPPVQLLQPGAADSLLNLRSDGLAYEQRFERTLRHTRRTLGLLACFLLVLAASRWFQADEYSKRTAELQVQARAVYAEVYPGPPPPIGAALRLASERRRLEGLTRSTSGSPQPSTDLLTLTRDVVAALPGNLRVNVQQFQLDQRELSLNGVTPTHADAERLAAALRQVPSLSPRPPRSDALKEGGVSFTLRSEWRPETSKSRPAAALTAEREQGS